MQSLYIEELLLNIIDNLEWSDILNLRYIINDYEKLDEIVYWKSLEHRKILTNNVYLLKNKYDWIIEQPLVPLYDYLKDQPNICIAGGYPTIQYLEKDLLDFKDSDIDIYIFGDKQVNTFKKLIKYLNKIIGIKEIRQFPNSYSIYNIYLNNIDRCIQIIGTCDVSISQIIREYDTSHNRCCLYQGETYITYDAKHAKQTNITYFNKNYENYKRLHKAHNLGLTIFHKPVFVENKDYYVGESNLIECNLKDAKNEFTPNINWRNEYITDEICSTNNDITKMLLTNTISLNDNVQPILIDAKYGFSILKLKELQTMKYNNKMNDYNLGEFAFTMSGKIVNSILNIKIKNFITHDIKQLNYLVDILEKVYWKHHKVDNAEYMKSFYKNRRCRIKDHNKMNIYRNNICIDNDIGYIYNLITPYNINLYLNKEMIFTIQPEMRIGSSTKNNQWYDGINGTYGHIKYRFSIVEPII